MSQFIGQVPQADHYPRRAYHNTPIEATSNPHRYLHVTIQELIAGLPSHSDATFTSISYLKRDGAKVLTSDGVDVTNLDLLNVRAKNSLALLKEEQIKLAVAQNDLKHAQKDVSDLKTGITIIAKLIGNQSKGTDNEILNLLDLGSQEEQSALDGIENHIKSYSPPSGNDSSSPTDKIKNLQELANTTKLISFGNNSTTVPNSPILIAQRTSFQAVSNMQDYGLESLESIMDSDMSGSGPAIAMQINTDNILQKNYSTPSILKASDGLTGVRGEEYDITKPRASPLVSRSFGIINKVIRYPTIYSKSYQQFERLDQTYQYQPDMIRDAAPDVFHHGIQYKPGLADKNYLRAVIITGFPDGTSLREVLLRVRGGLVVKSHLATVPAVGVSAYIQFAFEECAEHFAKYAKESSLSFGEKGDEALLRVKQLESASYPLTLELYQGIYILGHTRVLTIPNFPNCVSVKDLEESLVSALNRVEGFLLEVYFTDDALNLGFSSILAARSAFTVLTTYRCFKALFIVHYNQDFCSGAFEELSLPQQPRVPLHPRRRDQVKELPQKCLTSTALSTPAAPVPCFGGAISKGDPGLTWWNLNPRRRRMCGMISS